jgi:acetyl coenzyme A synthetase (ADP forming)-like protein
MEYDRTAVRQAVDTVLREGRSALNPEEAKRVCAAYGIAVPGDGMAQSAEEAAKLAAEFGYPVVLKVVSPDILHKSDAGGVLVGLSSAEEVRQGYEQILASARSHDPDARIQGVQVQQELPAGQEVIVGATTDPTFGKVVGFGIGGVMVEVLADITFRLAPTSEDTAAGMLDDIKAARVLDGARGRPGVDRGALARTISRVSDLVADFPEIGEVDLNPVLAYPDRAVAVDARILVSSGEAEVPVRRSQKEILAAMNRIMRPDAVAVIGASTEEGKIGNSVMKNLIEGGYKGEIYPVNPKADEVLGRKSYARVADIPGQVDVAVFAIPAKLVAQTMAEVGEKGIPGAVLLPSGFAETGNEELQAQVVEAARKHDVRFLGPNMYGIYYTPKSLCATFCTPYDVAGPVALTSQSGGIGMAILGFSRSSRMGVSAIVGVGNKADVDEDDLLTFFEQDDATSCVAMHLEDLKDGRAFVEIAERVSKTKPIVVLKAGRTGEGARAAGSHTGALAGNDKIYDDVFRQCGVVRAPGLNEMLEYARCLPLLPTPKGENVVIVTGAGGSGVLLSDACVDNNLSLMRIPPDLDAAYRELIPPFGAAGNPIDITGGEPPSTYRNAIALGLRDERIHALILGYWHTIVTPPMVFARLAAEVVEEHRRQGIDKPVVASLSGDVEVEEAAAYLFERGIVAYPYTTEKPVAMLGAKYRWARAAGLV